MILPLTMARVAASTSAAWSSSRSASAAAVLRRPSTTYLARCTFGASHEARDCNPIAALTSSGVWLMAQTGLVPENVNADCSDGVQLASGGYYGSPITSLLGTIELRLTATDRDQDLVIQPPRP